MKIGQVGFIPIFNNNTYDMGVQKQQCNDMYHVELVGGFYPSRSFFSKVKSSGLILFCLCVCQTQTSFILGGSQMKGFSVFSVSKLLNINGAFMMLGLSTETMVSDVGLVWNASHWQQRSLPKLEIQMSKLLSPFILPFDKLHISISKELMSSLCVGNFFVMQF